MVNRSCCCFGSKPRASEVSDAAGNGAKVHTTNGLDLNPTTKAGAGDINGAKPKSKGPTPGPILVELFTSQGCTTSPAADLLISKLGQGNSSRELELDVPVIFLAYHVEYWDYLGWKDPFASSLWTVRQRAYGQSLQQDSIYTPQVVVQGRSQCLGSDTESVLSLIRSAPRFTSSEIKTTIARPSESSIEVSLSGPLRFKVEGYSLDILVALYENGLVTDCTKGENKGRVLTNDFVVRCLEKACTVKDVSARKTVTGKVTFNLWEGYSRSKCGLVMFFQNASTLEIQGAQSLEFPDV